MPVAKNINKIRKVKCPVLVIHIFSVSPSEEELPLNARIFFLFALEFFAFSGWDHIIGGTRVNVPRWIRGIRDIHSSKGFCGELNNFIRSPTGAYFVVRVTISIKNNRNTASTTTFIGTTTSTMTSPITTTNIMGKGTIRMLGNRWRCR